MAQQHGPHLVMPLRPLPNPPARMLHLADEGLLAWGTRVREALEPCALIDGEGRLTALSCGAASLLGLDPATSVGALTSELLTLVDFSAEAAPLADRASHSPTMRVLTSGGPARGLVRVRQSDCVRTYDVVAVPLAGGVGVLAFVSEV